MLQEGGLGTCIQKCALTNERREREVEFIGIFVLNEFFGILCLLLHIFGVGLSPVDAAARIFFHMFTVLVPWACFISTSFLVMTLFVCTDETTPRAVRGTTVRSRLRPCVSMLGVSQELGDPFGGSYGKDYDYCVLGAMSTWCHCCYQCQWCFIVF